MDVIEVASQFDSIIDNAIEEKQLRVYGELLPMSGAPRSWRVADVAQAYQEQTTYPPERLPGLVDRLIDLKLQVYYIREFDVGLYNWLYYDELHKLGLGRTEVPTYLVLRRMSLDQGLIGKSRIAWQRLMNLVFFLEHGKEIPGRSKKRSFFRWVNEVAERKWSFLAPYEAGIVKYDAKYRTPEFHKNSVLRPELIHGVRIVDPNALLGIANLFDPLWTNIHDVIGGRWPSVLTGLHFKTEFVIDGRYLIDGRDA